MGDVEGSRCLECEAELKRIRTENDQLRRSASAFGELAERLNEALIIITGTIVRRPPLDRKESGGGKEPSSSFDDMPTASSAVDRPDQVVGSDAAEQVDVVRPSG